MPNPTILASHSCLALDGGYRCSRPPAVDSKWCARHEEDQAKIRKQYKRISFELETFHLPDLCHDTVHDCCDQNVLREWSECYRRKWILTKRTIESRAKHHRLFYAGGDVSHMAHIEKLSSQQMFLEEMLLCIDDRAYQLLVSQQNAQWLDAPVALGPVCSDDTDISTLDLGTSVVQRDKEDAASSSDHSDSDHLSSFSAGDSSSSSSASCTSGCCDTPLPKAPKTLTSQDKLLAYFDIASGFEVPGEADLAKGTIEGIFRHVISRIPRLLVRVLSLDLQSVQQLLQGDRLDMADYDRLWRAMKYTNVHQEGKITVQVVRNAICDAENVDREDERSGAFIVLLGGKVWKSPLDREMSPQGWNMFYRFTSCSGCALAVTRTFSAWARNRRLSLVDSSYATWAEAGESPGERRLRRLGVVLAGGYKKGKSGCIEHVRPKKKGLNSVWIERDSRNWCFLRICPDASSANALSSVEAGSLDNLTAFSWTTIPSIGDVNPGREEVRATLTTVSSVAREPTSYWVSRLRSGNTPVERKAARWTVDSSLRHTKCTHDRLLASSPETYFHKGEPFRDGSVDVVVIDTSQRQNYEDFLQRIAERLQAAAGETGEDNAKTDSLNDRALFLGRTFFREVV